MPSVSSTLAARFPVASPDALRPCPTELHHLGVVEASRLIERRQVSPVELTQAFLGRIQSLDPQLSAFLLPTPEHALAQARAAEAEIGAGRRRGVLHGVPFALKDIFSTAGIRTTGHSLVRADAVPTQDAAAVARLHDAGGVLLGKLATHEFAHGGPSFDLPFPPARNPWNPEHIPGGSSSGSGAAVAAGLVRMAMGSDTGGSIRGPAAYCGTVGLKPTYGLVSRRGVFPLSTTLDHCGPLSWTVEDSAVALQVIAGYDPLDPASVDLPVPDYRAGLRDGVEGLRIALPRHFYRDAEGLSPEVAASIDQAAETLSRLGAVVEEVTLPP